ncbi:phenazine biosynthesis protein phzF [Peziza echinospora]|nr:phenazine biosynthesis protein phzF [Peziza echinospora]
MPTLRFVTLDVFTTVRYEGNPLAVVIVPADQSSSLTHSQKLKITAEFNLSETIFLHEEEEENSEIRDDDHEIVKIDIFTPGQELPFAGHPTIGASYYLYNLRPAAIHNKKKKENVNVTLKTLAGLIPTTNPRPGVASLHVPHDTHLHRNGVSITDVLIRHFPALGRPAFHPSQPESAPLFSIVKGMTFALVRLNTVQDLARVSVASAVLANDGLLDEPWHEGFIGVFFYCVEDYCVVDGGITATWKVRARMVAGPLEDPATGSASCALSAYLAQQDAAAAAGGSNSNDNNNTTRKHVFEIIQGVEMGRRSVIGTEVVVRREGNGEAEVVSVGLTGTAVKVMEGTLEY